MHDDVIVRAKGCIAPLVAVTICQPSLMICQTSEQFVKTCLLSISNADCHSCFVLEIFGMRQLLRSRDDPFGHRSAWRHGGRIRHN